MVQSWIANRKIKQSLKVFLYICIWIGNMHYNSKSFIYTRALTIYDHLNVDRFGTFEDFKLGKDNYLELLSQEEEDYFTVMSQ